MIQNFLVTSYDNIIVHTMYGPNLSGTRGNKFQHKLDEEMMYYLAVPREFWNYGSL